MGTIARFPTSIWPPVVGAAVRATNVVGAPHSVGHIHGWGYLQTDSSLVGSGFFLVIQPTSFLHAQ